MAKRTTQYAVNIHGTTPEFIANFSAPIRNVRKVWVYKITIGGVPLTGGRPTDNFYTVQFTGNALSVRSTPGLPSTSTVRLSGIPVALTGTVTVCEFNPPRLIYNSISGIRDLITTGVEVHRQSGSLDANYLDSVLIELYVETDA